MTAVIFLERNHWGGVSVSREPLEFEDGPERFGRLAAAMEGERWVAENPDRNRYELAMGGNPWVRRPGAARRTSGPQRRPA